MYQTAIQKISGAKNSVFKFLNCLGWLRVIGDKIDDWDTSVERAIIEDGWGEQQVGKKDMSTFVEKIIFLNNELTLDLVR